MSTNTPLKRQLRVELYPDGGATVIDLNPDRTRHVHKIENLPLWVQERLAVLTVLGKGKRVEGVGERILDHVYWIDKPE